VFDEELKSFSSAYKEGLLGNEDDDYYMDQLEVLRDRQELFLAELEKQHHTKHGASDDDDDSSSSAQVAGAAAALQERLCAAVKVVRGLPTPSKGGASATMAAPQP
jgi:hypothetical protein